MSGIMDVVDQKDLSASDETQSRRDVVHVDQMPGIMLGMDQEKGHVGEQRYFGSGRGKRLRMGSN